MQVSNIYSKSADFPDIRRHPHKPVESLNILGTLPNDAKMIAIVGTCEYVSYAERVTR
jgi:hypothetical protein